MYIDRRTEIALLIKKSKVFQKNAPQRGGIDWNVAGTEKPLEGSPGMDKEVVGGRLQPECVVIKVGKAVGQQTDGRRTS